MSFTVSGAFETFRKNFVDLEDSQVQKARASRDAMLDRINNLSGFLPLYRACHMQFGSFARNTKTRPIDDIDLIVCLSGGDLEICDVKSWADIRLKLKNLQSPLKICCDSTNSSSYTYYSDYLFKFK
jgi:predicted nucleotidyltransferase